MTRKDLKITHLTLEDWCYVYDKYKLSYENILEYMRLPSLEPFQ